MSQQRDRVIKLVKTDADAAFRLARSISDVREKIQALGWVARFGPAVEIPRVISAVKKAAGTSADIFGDTMALAWPLRALHETGHGKQIPPLLNTAVRLSANVHPAASRAEALLILMHAVIPNDFRTAEPAIAALKRITDTHWRVVRALTDAALIVNAFDTSAASEIAAAISVDNKRKSALERLSAGETKQPRAFFW